MAVSVAITRRHNRRHDAADRIEFAVLEQTIWRGGNSFFMSPQQFRLALVMTVAAANRISLTTDELVDALYADDIDGGPDTASIIVRKHIWRFRMVFRPLGMTVIRERQNFYRMSIEPMLGAIAA
ncbi:hypothetical protein LJR231_001582 [Phyllobacterium sp. LjRoot231]|uniref:hypothetical protein n=1 Tax=Phyllobacterium sp. LjRoot231 TaxID=3342289 RepID=UPI003ED0FAC7